MSVTRWLMVASALAFIAPASAFSQAQSGAARNGGARSGGDSTKAAYAPIDACADCHAAQYKKSDDVMSKVILEHPRTEHEKLGCQACHGPAQAHAESGGDVKTGLVTFGRKSKVSVNVRNEACVACHEKSAQMWWEGSTHEERGVACTDCHSAHNPVKQANLKAASTTETCGSCHQQQKNAQMRFAHMPIGERKMECSSCHNPHGSPNPKMLLASSANETCFSCHAEKRGPYLWNHAPVTESCTNCHDSHGSSQPKMLKASMPRLCQQCHAGAQRHPPTPRQPTQGNVMHVYNRSCTNCHTQIHGSNHPSGFAFTR